MLPGHCDGAGSSVDDTPARGDTGGVRLNNNVVGRTGPTDPVVDGDNDRGLGCAGHLAVLIDIRGAT